MVWELFCPDVRRAIEKRGFGNPSPVQKEAIPSIISGKHTLVIAPTGFGKTESAVLPVFDKWMRKGSEGNKTISILYITPLKSLNRDMLDRILWWSKELGFEVSVRHGDTTQYERGMQSQNPPDMLISTPETLQAMLTGKNIRENISNVKWVIVDEIHELVESKRGVQLSLALERLKWLARERNGTEIQLIGLSATVGTPEKVADFLTAGGECNIIDVAGKRKISLSVTSPLPSKKDEEMSEYMFIEPETAVRMRLIKELIKKNKSTLVFTNTREFAEVLSSRMNAFSADIGIETHHSSLSKESRIETEKRFKAGDIQALICTSSLELGIDIGSINLVIQYLSPRQVSKLLQRVGRSGHKMAETSKGVLISSDADDCFEASAIAKAALNDEIEQTKIYKGSLDVLGQQIVGMAIEEYSLPLKKAYEIIKNAYCYKHLTYDEFEKIALFSQKIGNVWVNKRYTKEISLQRGKRSFEYYYTNLSTIPDVKSYKVIEIASNKPVGSLDAEFVALHGSPGTSFIVSGHAWRILEVTDSKIIVEQASGVEAPIPAWEGELLPVPYEIAQEVGRMRGKVRDLQHDNKDAEKWLMDNYPVKKDAAKKMSDSVAKQDKFGFVPTDKGILIETYEDNMVIHSLFGSLVNETIGRCLTTLLSSRIGSVGLQSDPYRIMLKVPGRQWKIVMEAFYELKPEAVEGLLRVSLPHTELFHWHFIHVAKRFGIMKRDSDYGKGYIKKIVDVYKGTPAYEETLNEIFTEKLDIEKTEEIIKGIREGKYEIVQKQGLSPFGEYGLIRKYEIVAPERPDSEILKAFKNRLLRQSARLVCCNCGGLDITYRLKNLPDKIQCPVCEAKLIGVIHPKANAQAKIIKKYVKKKDMTKAEMKAMNDIMDGASIVMAHGKDAIIALSARGIGPKVVVRVLEKVRRGYDLYKEILEAEKQFVRTKRFWK